MKLYTEYREKININNKSQWSRTTFLANCGSLALYDKDKEKRFIIDHEQLQFDKNDGWKLISNPEEPDDSLLYHEYFCIHDDLFDIIQ